MILPLTLTNTSASFIAVCLAVGAYILAGIFASLKISPSSTGIQTKQLLAINCLLPAAWIFHAGALGMTLIDWTSPHLLAHIGFAPFLSMTMWCVVGIYLFEQLDAYRQGVHQILSLLSVLSLVLTWFFPGQAQIFMGNHWASLHWFFALISYGLMGAALLHAGFWQMAERRLRQAKYSPAWPSSSVPLLSLEALAFKFIFASFTALSLTLVLGIWQSHNWRWEHKTVLSILAWAVFACLLLGRKTLGWRGRTAIGWLYAGSALLVLAYVGSRFVFEVILRRPGSLG